MPEADRYLAKAHESLGEARQIIQIGLAAVAARSAYYAAFHAAEAYIFAKTGRVGKTHAGVRTEFVRLARNEAKISRAMTTFLPKAYQYKEIGDYNIDPKIVVTMLNAETAITAAEEFLTCIGSILA